jgi:hypothetical protein
LGAAPVQIYGPGDSPDRPPCTITDKRGAITEHLPAKKSRETFGNPLIVKCLILLAQALKKRLMCKCDAYGPRLANIGLVINLCEFIG